MKGHRVTPTKKQRDAARMMHCLAMHDLLVTALANALDPNREDSIDADVDAARALLKREVDFNKGRQVLNGRNS